LHDTLRLMNTMCLMNIDFSLFGIPNSYEHVRGLIRQMLAGVIAYVEWR
jgi:hypothetical protein